MNQKNYVWLLMSIMLLCSLAGCKKRAIVAPDKAQQTTVQPKLSNKRTARKMRQLLKSCQSFASYAQEEYEQEIALIEQTKNIQQESETLAKKIKEIAIKRHEEHLKSWSNFFDVLFETDFTRNTPLRYYQLEFEPDAVRAHDLARRIKKKSDLLIETEDKNLAEQIAKIDRALTEVHTIIRFDLDFVRDKQACTVDINTRRYYKY